MQAKLFFGINLGYNQTLNEQLKELSSLKFWDKGLQKYVYIFSLNKLNEVIALTGKEIDFEHEKDEIVNLVHHTPTLKEEIITDKYKGQGFLYIQKFPKIYIVKTVMRKEEQTFKIPVETVQAAWRAISKNLKIDEVKKSKDLAEFWCDELKIDRFHRQSGSFDSDKMYGTRQIYFKWYYSLKILEKSNVIKYLKSGLVKRISEKWEMQGEFNESN